MELKQNYDIKKIIVANFNGNEKTNEGIVYCVKVKDLIKNILEDLESDEILLISGPSAFTLNVRYELLAKLGF